LLSLPPIIRATKNNTKNMKENILATHIILAAIFMSPNKAAIKAITKNGNDKHNIVLSALKS